MASPMTPDSEDCEFLLRRIIREEAGVTPAVPAERWRGGTLVLRPAEGGGQGKSWPIETFFHKFVMVRNCLRTVEQQVNASELPADVKAKLQGYVSGRYGSLTSFNVLFADPGRSDQGKRSPRGIVCWSATDGHARPLDTTIRRGLGAPNGPPLPT